MNFNKGRIKGRFVPFLERDSVAILTKGSRDGLDLPKKRVSSLTSKIGPSYQRSRENLRLFFNDALTF